ncbi:PHD-zinc-finger like domain-containing protein [Phlyctochytrium arcticum]|nr:PHD-zinc-finger like domain-containing protein [Phlyctochytrium arcticum]
MSARTKRESTGTRRMVPKKTNSKKVATKVELSMVKNENHEVAQDSGTLMMKGQDGRLDFLAEWKSKQPGLCCICIEGQGSVVVCAGADCAVVVHPFCVAEESVATFPGWKCPRCRLTDSSFARCVICPSKDGYLRQIADTDYWIHTLCLSWTLEARNEALADRTVITHHDIKDWKKECSICTSQGDKSYGCKRSCDAAQCKNAVHATCASDYNLLEELPDPDMAHPYFVYCKQHATHDARLNPWAKWVRSKYKGLADIERNEKMVPLKGERQYDPCAIIETAFAQLKEGQDAEVTRLMHDTIRNEAERNSHQIALQKLHKDLANSERNIDESRRELQSLLNETDSFKDDLISMFRTFDHRNGSPAVDRSDVIDRLFQTSSDASVKAEFEATFVAAYLTAQKQPTHTEDIAPAYGPKSFITPNRRGPGRKKALWSHGKGVSGICAICRTFEGAGSGGNASQGTPPACPAHMIRTDSTSSSQGGGTSSGRRLISAYRLIQCTQCARCFHSGCLDPPVTRMPPRGYAWRCEECDSSADTSAENSPVEKRKADFDEPDPDSEDLGNRPKRLRSAPTRYTT